MCVETIIKVDKNDDKACGSIAEALGAAGGYWGLPVTIEIAPGIYNERFTVIQPRITLSGHPGEKTVISYHQGALEILNDGIKRGTFRTAVMMVDGSSFTAQNLTFENTAGPGDTAGQALAVYVDAETAYFENCRFLGHQDTLFLAPLPPEEREKNGFAGPKEAAPRSMGYHYFKNCFIEGDVDFIFGGASAYFEDCEIFSKNRDTEINGYVTAPCTPENERYGLTFYHCRFTSDCPPGTVYLGRPWRNYGRTVLIRCRLDAHIHPEGFHDWSNSDARKTCFFAEYGNQGEGSEPTGRAPFIHQLLAEESEKYSRENCLREFYLRHKGFH